jgi:ribosomal protein L35AE/L33A
MNAARLSGENIKPHTTREARALIGKSVTYLRESDIDHSGRGHYFPQKGTVVAVHGRNLAINDPNNFVAFSEIAEMVAA